MTLRDAAQQALEALLTYEQYIQPLTNYFGGPRVPEEGSASAKVDAAITALRAALAGKNIFDRWYSEFPPLTPWFPPTKRPVRPGVYMVDQSWPDQLEQPVFSLWDGKNWHPQGSTPEDALKWACYGPIKTGRYRPHAFRKWRGLIKHEEPAQEPVAGEPPTIC